MGLSTLVPMPGSPKVTAIDDDLLDNLKDVPAGTQ